MFVKFLPIAFALLWSTGFVGAKYGLPYIEPYSFLTIRFVITLLVLSVLIVLLKPSFPKNKKIYFHVFVSGVLIHVAYLGGVFTAIKLGLPAGVTAVIVGVQPVLTTILVYRLKSPLMIALTLMGFVGLMCVIFDSETNFSAYGVEVYLPSVIALLGITLGTLYQKKHCVDINIVANAFLQYIPTALIFGILMLLFEPNSQIVWSRELVLALLWLSLVISVGAILLMNVLYQSNSASSAANYFYLAPPLALAQGYLLFGETISLFNLFGMILIVVSLYMVARVKGPQ